MQTPRAFKLEDSWITDPCVGDFELPQYVLRHVVLGGRINDEILISSGAFCRPVLVTLLLQSNSHTGHTISGNTNFNNSNNIYTL